MLAACPLTIQSVHQALIFAVMQNSAGQRCGRLERMSHEAARVFHRSVATGTIEEAALLTVFIEHAARMQVLAQSIGTIKPIEPTIAREAHDYRLKPRAVAASFYYFARRVLKQGHDVLE